MTQRWKARLAGVRRRVASPGRDTQAPQISAVGVLFRAAALLRGGVVMSRVWEVMAAEGISPPASLGAEWRVILAAWSLAKRTGAPLAAVLERLALALRDLEKLSERRSVLLAGPRATIRLVSVLPVAAFLLAALLGFDPLSVLITPAGAILCVLGIGLLSMGALWASRLTQRLARMDSVAGLECEFAWIAISGGVPPNHALRLVADHASAARADWVRLARLRKDGPVWTVFATAAALGTPAGPLLLSEADSARAHVHAELEAAAEQLGVRVLVPLAVCVLPSFVLLGVLPVLMAVLGGVIA